MHFPKQIFTKTFYLPNETPRYKLLLETNATPMEEQILSLLLRFLSRIYNKPSDSLIKNCLSRLMANKSVKTKFNWYSQAVSFLEQCGICECDKSLKFVSSASKVTTLLNKYKLLHQKQLIRTMKSSSELYSKIKSRIRTECYLNLNIKFVIKRLLFQIRCGNNYIYQNETCDLLGTRKNGFKECDICNL